MPTPVRDKYYLKTLHEEIGLLDRKLAHLLKYDSFATDKERDAAAAKLSTKRGQLVRTAQEMVSAGIEFKPSEQPRSLAPDRPEPSVAQPEAQAVAPEVAVGQGHTLQHLIEAGYAGTSLDYRSTLDEYKRNRRKTA